MRPPDRGWTLHRDEHGALAVRHQGNPGRIEVIDSGGRPWAALLRDAQNAVQRGAPPLSCVWDGAIVGPTRPPPRRRAPCRRVLFFESLMNAELPHNDGELS